MFQTLAAASQFKLAGLGGFVGFDYSALPVIFAAHSIRRSEWRSTIDRLSVITRIAYEYWKPEQKKP